MKLKIGMKCWFRDRPAVLIGGTSRNGFIRFVDGTKGTATVLMSNLVERRSDWSVYKKRWF